MIVLYQIRRLILYEIEKGGNYGIRFKTKGRMHV